jgi:YfiH family protein
MTDFENSFPSTLQYRRSRLIESPHAMFNRLKGTSPPPYSSLNLSYGVGDDPQCVAANRQRTKQALGISLLLSAKQVHGEKICCAPDIAEDTEVEGYDALITSQPGVGLLIQQADCQAILIHDPVRKVVAAIHCGWRGNAVNIIGKTIAEIRKRYHSNASSLLVAISPSLGPCCAELINYRHELPEQIHHFQVNKSHFNFWAISKHQLTEAGVPSEHIDAAGICSACDRNYFSYRRTKKQGKVTTGRYGSVISLPPT